MVASSPAREPARPAGILGKFLVLVLFAGLAASIVSSLRSPTLDWDVQQHEYFGADGCPAGLTFAEGLVLPSGDRVACFTCTPGEGRAASSVSFYEFTRLEGAEAHMRANGSLFGLEAAGKLAEWERAKDFEWTALRKRGECEWGDWRAKLVILRHFEQGGAWSDEARVDLSTRARPLVLSLRWPALVAADEAELRALLLSVPLTPDEN